MCGDVEIKETKVDKWLGQCLSSGGLADSVMETIKAKEGKVRGACLEVASIVEDWRAKAVGGIEAAFILWESCCIPTLLSGSGNWLNITGAAEQKLEALQHWFVRLVLRVGPGCPAPCLRWETGLLSMRMRIWVEKLMLVRHVRGLDISTIARRVYEEQKLQKWPGLVREAAAICEMLGLEDANEVDMTRWNTKQYRKIIIEACKLKDEKELREAAAGLKKCERIMEDHYGKKEYMSTKNLSEVRSTFYTRVQMHPFGGNFSHDKRFQKTNWLCACGEAREEVAHLVGGECPVYGDIREEFPDTLGDDILTDFFTLVLERRKEREEEETGAMAAGRGAADCASPPGQASA